MPRGIKWGLNIFFFPSPSCRKSPSSHDDQGSICCFPWRALTNTDVNSCLKVLKLFGRYKVNESEFRDKPEWEILKQHKIMEWAAETISNRFLNSALRKSINHQSFVRKGAGNGEQEQTLELTATWE